MIIVIGDIHGKISGMSEKIQSMNPEMGTAFVHLGDFGLGFDSPIKEYKKLKGLDFILSMTDSMMYIIRGNHDNPTYWDQNYSFEFPRIKFVPDNTFMEIKGKMCFFAGGAISIDRLNRNKGANYWPMEHYQFCVPNEVPTRVDHVFTHDVYHPCSIFNVDSQFTQRWFTIDPNLRQDLIKSQRQMEKMYDFLMSINQDFSWYHGHYHESNVMVNGKQKTHSISIMEFKEVF